MPDDKRRFPRLRSLNIVAEKGRIFRTLDLSREGMLLEMDTPAALGTRVQLDLAVGDDIIDVSGEVMRHVHQENGRIAVGIRFSRMAPRSERALREYLLKKQK